MKNVLDELLGKKKSKKKSEEKALGSKEGRKVMDSGHGKLKKRKLTKKQQKELMAKNYTYVTVSGDRRKLTMDRTFDAGTTYKVYDRSDKPGKSIRDPQQDWQRVAEHTSSDMEKKPFQGDL